MNNDFFKDRFESYDVAEFSFYGSVQRDLDKFIKEQVRFFNFPNLELTPKRLSYLTKLLVEFAEDLHYDVGLWRSVEEYNQKLFYTPLPLIVRYKHEIKQKFDKNRFKFFIFNMMLEFKPNLVMSPQHSGLEQFSKQLSTFFKAHFKNAPTNSTFKLFLNEYNNTMWDFKQKVVFVGTKSYLYRLLFRNYYKNKKISKDDIEMIDKFVNEIPSIWSGVLANEITAMVANLPNNLLDDIKTWYLRHMSFYKCIAINPNKMVFKNILNDQLYDVYHDGVATPFKENHFVIGALVKFNGIWYWSGSQHLLGLITDEKKIQEFKNEMILEIPKQVYRYNKELLAQAQKINLREYNGFVEFFGSSLVVFENASVAELELRKKELFMFEKLPEEEKKNYFDKYGKDSEIAKLKFPEDLLANSGKLAAYYNKETGLEIFENYEYFVNILKKKGVDLSNLEIDFIQYIITDNIVSPQFIKLITDEYGTESIQVAFKFDIENDNLDYLFRKYKGKFFRPLFPNVSINIG